MRMARSELGGGAHPTHVVRADTSVDRGPCPERRSAEALRLLPLPVVATGRCILRAYLPVRPSLLACETDVANWRCRPGRPPAGRIAPPWTRWCPSSRALRQSSGEVVPTGHRVARGGKDRCLRPVSSWPLTGRPTAMVS